MADYKTPGRQPTAASANMGCTGSVGRRVVRSALELLVETASPDLVRQQDVSLSPKAAKRAPAKFTVIHTAAPPAPVEETRILPSFSSTSNTSTATTGHHQNYYLPVEEPSTLQFLSPTSTRGGGDSAVKKRLFKKKLVKISDSARKKKKMVLGGSNGTREEAGGVGTSFWDADAAAAISASASASAGRREKSPHGQNGLTHYRNEPLFTEEEVQQRVVEALKAYEASRDAEEESVLQEVGREIESQNERYEKLLQEKRVVVKERDGFHTKMEQLAQECGVLQTTIAALHQELQEEREKVSRVEVELCHAQDKARLASSGVQQELNFEKAQWKLSQEEARQQMHELEAQLKSRADECRELQEALASKENERVQALERLEDSQKETQQLRKQHGELESTNAEVQELARAKEAFIRQLQHRLQEAERAVKRVSTTTRDEHVQLETRLQSVEGALQQQTDEVRRKMHRVHMLEVEQAKAERVTRSLRHVVREAFASFSAIHTALGSCVEACRTVVPQAAARHARPQRRGLRCALFPAERSTAADDESVCGNEATTAWSEKWDVDMELGLLADEKEEEEEGDYGDSNDVHHNDKIGLLRPLKHRGLKKELQRGGLVSEKSGAAQRERQRRFQVGGFGGQGPAKRCADTEGVQVGSGDADECGRLHRCQRQCERLLETLQRLFVRNQEEARRHIARLEAQHAEQSETEVAQCRDALAVCQTNLEQGKRQQQLLEDKCLQYSGEIQQLEGKLVELRFSEEETKAQQKHLMGSVEKLQCERDVLQLQLKVSQQDCVELRERYESIRTEAGEVQERLRLLEETQRGQEAANEAKNKVLARLARCTERLKKTEGECETLRSENSALSTKVKSLLLQLQTSRAHQRGKSATSPARQKQSEELSALTRELGALRGLQESAAALHAKEHAEAESSKRKLRAQNDGLRDELMQVQRALADARNEVVLQQRAETVTLRTLLSIHQESFDNPIESRVDSQSDGVQQRLFDCSPTPSHAKDGGVAVAQMEMTMVEMRGRVVSLAQRAVLELARLREACSQAPRVEMANNASTTAAGGGSSSSILDSFHVSEKLALESAQRSAARRQVFSDNWDAVAPPPPPPPPPQSRVEPALRTIEQRHYQSCLLGTPQRHVAVAAAAAAAEAAAAAAAAASHKSPSPMQEDGEAMSSAIPLRHSTSFGAANLSKSAAGNRQSLLHHGASLVSLTSSAGVSRSRSGHGLVDGSSSPARPPMLRAASMN